MMSFSVCSGPSTSDRAIATFARNEEDLVRLLVEATIADPVVIPEELAGLRDEG